MQITLAGPALITALPSLGGNGEGASFFNEAWELHGQIPHGPKSPLASGPMGSFSHRERNGPASKGCRHWLITG